MRLPSGSSHNPQENVDNNDDVGLRDASNSPTDTGHNTQTDTNNTHNNPADTGNNTQTDTNNTHNNPADTANDCTASSCSGATPICNETSGSCVECIESSQCDDDVANNLPGICNADNTCGFDPNACLPGFVDLDGNPANGCECKITNPNDILDLNGTDTNCDGVDGILGDNVLFVSATTGNATNDGKTPQTAKKSIQDAIQNATDDDVPYVLVAAGQYPEAITLIDGVNVFGGYNPTTWKRDISTFKTNVKIGESAYDPTTNSYTTVSAKNITEPTTFSGFTIVGFDASPTNKGASSIALWSLNSENLAIEHTQIIAGQAAAGESFQQDNAVPLCMLTENEKKNAPFQQYVCDGLENTPAPSGKKGDDAPGAPTSGGHGGVGGAHGCELNGLIGGAGGHGRSGAIGQHATPLTSAALGSLSDDGTWLPPTANNPKKGTEGAGGGGAGGSLSYFGAPGQADTMHGGPGGNGGKGGCGGAPGKSGQSGGTSIAAAIIGGNVQFTENHIVLASGGAGGNGGKGGNGGDGVAGNGGNAIGIALANNAVVQETDITYDDTSATAGAGGTATIPARNGHPGTVEQIVDYSN